MTFLVDNMYLSETVADDGNASVLNVGLYRQEARLSLTTRKCREVSLRTARLLC